MAFLSLDKVNYAYGDNVVLKDMSLSLINPMNVAIVGNPGSGKTTLLKLLNGDIFGKNKISLCDVDINLENFRTLKRIINVVFDDDIFIKDTVLEELKNPLYNLILKPSEGVSRLNELIDVFALDDILDVPINELSMNDKMLIKILAVLITKPRVIGFDNVLGYLLKEDREVLFKYLKKKGIKYILTTTNMEEVLDSDYLLVLYNGSVAIEGETLSVLKEERLLRRLGLDLPFYVDLSIQLGYYEIIKGIYLNKEDMVNEIWK